MLPATDFALRCESPVAPNTMSGRPIDIVVFEYEEGPVAYISTVGAGRAGYFARTVASRAQGFEIVARPEGLVCSVAADQQVASRLKELRFDAENRLLKLIWQDCPEIDFGGACVVQLAPFYAWLMPNRDPSQNSM